MAFQIQGKSKISVPVKKEKSVNFSDLLKKDIQLFGSSFSLKNKENFYDRLSVLLKAGLDIRNALELLEKGEKKKNIKRIYSGVKEHLIQGHSFSESLGKEKVFSEYEIHNIRIGEETGRLIAILENMKDYFGKLLKYKRQFIQALSYPVFVILFSLLVVGFLLNFLVPMFEDVYAKFEGGLPAITQFIIDCSDFMANFGLYILGGFLLFCATVFYFRKTELIRKVSAFLILHLPIFGGIIKRIYLTRLCSSLFMLLSSKVPLVNAVQLVQKMIGFYPIEKSLGAIEGKLVKGATLSDSLHEYSFYPSELTALVKVGEESGKLDEMFKTLTEQYSAETEQRTAVVGSLLEPILIVFLGVIVGFILIAMYLPMFEMSSGLG